MNHRDKLLRRVKSDTFLNIKENKGVFYDTKENVKTMIL